MTQKSNFIDSSCDNTRHRVGGDIVLSAAPSMEKVIHIFTGLQAHPGVQDMLDSVVMP